MKFTAIGRTMGDETTPYAVTEYRAKTAAEFVNEVSYCAVCLVTKTTLSTAIE